MNNNIIFSIKWATVIFIIIVIIYYIRARINMDSDRRLAFLIQNKFKRHPPLDELTVFSPEDISAKVNNIKRNNDQITATIKYGVNKKDVSDKKEGDFIYYIKNPCSTTDATCVATM